MKGLEALKRLSAVASMYCDECATSEEDLDRGMFEKDYQAVKTIEKELKRLEKYDKTEVSALIESHKKLLKEKKAIEKELKQAEENKKVLNIFKNALTIERHDNTVLEKPSDDLDLQGTISYLTRQVITIKQNELDKSLRDTLREWVLKNAFPKDLKALEIIKNKRVIVGRLIFSKDLWEYNNYVSYDMELTQEEYDLLKEMLL